MGEIDQRLRGKGFQERVQRRSIEDKYDRMKEFIETRIRAEIEMWRLASSSRLGAKKERPGVFKREPSLYGIGINIPEASRQLKDKLPRRRRLRADAFTIFLMRVSVNAADCKSTER
jgi:hypothetical protein